jgi:ribosome-associated protein
LRVCDPQPIIVHGKGEYLPGRFRIELDADMPTIAFQLTHDHVELNQLLKLAGLCDSGGIGKAIVASGAVTVDGIVELRKTCKIRAGQVVRIADIEIRVAQP